MKASLFFALAGLASSVCAGDFLERRATACKAGNNCQRGVNGTAGNKPPRSSRLADCSSYMSITIVPSPITTTVSTTTTYTTSTSTTAGVTLRKRADLPVLPEGWSIVSPTATPTYATYCDNPSAYASACSCAGVTAGTTTAATPTVEVIATETCVVREFAKRAMEWGRGMMDGMGDSMGLRRDMTEMEEAEYHKV